MSVAMTFQKHTGAVRRFSWLMKFSSWLQNIPNKITPPPFRLMQIGSAFWQSRALYVATQVDIATSLGDERLSIEDIAMRVSASSEATHRLLRMLAAMGIFEEVSPRVFCNNKLSNHLRQDFPNNVRAMILMHNSEEMSRPWYEQLEHGVRNDETPFQLSHGQDLFDHMSTHPEFDALFSHAMDCVESLSGDSFAVDFDWGRFERVIDIGGSKGSKSLTILKRHPHLQALIVDRPQVIKGAKQFWEGRLEESLLARMRFQAGDLFKSLPEANSDKDVFLLSAVLHCFDDDTCVEALKNVALACNGSGARIALMEMVMTESNADFVSTQFDMQMFMGTRGRERTLAEWQHLFDRSGLLLDEVVNLQSFGKILVVRPG
ncbi:MAG: methyltransferase [Halopseudomonas sp.]